MTRLENLYKEKAFLEREEKRIVRRKNAVNLAIVTELNRLNADPEEERQRRREMLRKAINY